MLRSVDAQLGDLERLQAPWGICVLHLCGVFHQAARAVVDHEARTVRLLLVDTDGGCKVRVGCTCVGHALRCVLLTCGGRAGLRHPGVLHRRHECAVCIAGEACCAR